MRSQIIIPSSGVIDLYNDVPISLNYQIADVKEPEKRQTSYSKTIRIPGSQNNNKMFMHVWNITIDNQFDVSKKVSAILIVDNNEVMRGFMQLLKITNLGFEKIEYEIAIWGETANLFYALGNKRFNDLAWTDLNHTLNINTVALSWNPPGNYWYPFIDLGMSTNGIDYPIEAFRPALKLKYLFDKLLLDSGFTYTSNFLTSGFFARLYALNLTPNFSQDSTTIDNNSMRASAVSQQVYAVSVIGYSAIHEVGNLTLFDNDTSAPNHDSGNIHNVISGETTIGITGNYNIFSDISTTVFYDHLLPPSPITPKFKIYVYAQLQLYKNSTWNVIANSNEYIVDYGFTTFEDDYETNIFNLSIGLTKFLNAGEKLKIILIYRPEDRWSPSGYATVDVTFNYTIRTKTNSYLEVQLNPEIVAEATVPGNAIVPQKMIVKDFILTIIKMFNLYVSVDKDNPNKLLIEPRDDYYNSTVVDWSKKLDVSRQIEIRPLAASEASRYIFTYKKDSDYLNDLYYTHYEEVYGSRIIDSHNDFLPNEKKTELVFSATPLFRSIVSDRFLNRIFTMQNNQAQKYSSESLRLFYYPGNTRTCQNWFLHAGSSSLEIDYYPYAGHLDDPIAPTIDLSFGIPREVFYVPTQNATYTDNNLYNRYWKKFIQEITDKNSKIVTAYFRLRPADINQLDFRKLYYFADDYFRLNKIYDYNPIHEGVTKCEFIKVITKAVFSSGSHLLTGGSHDKSFDDTNYDWPLIGTIDRSKAVLVNSSDSGTATGTAAESAQKLIIQSNENVVGERCREITLLGSSGNIILGGLDRVSMINTSGRTVIKSGESFIHGFKQGTTKLNTRSISGDTQLTTEDCIVFGDSTTGNVYAYLPSAKWDKEYKLNGFTYYIKKSSYDTNKVIASGTELINTDGRTSTSYSLMTANPKVTLVSDGNLWHVITD